MIMRNFDLSPLYRSAIGFDRLFNLLENSQSQSNGGYPPYNVELVDENHYTASHCRCRFRGKRTGDYRRDNLLVVKALMRTSRKNVPHLYQGHCRA